MRWTFLSILGPAVVMGALGIYLSRARAAERLSATTVCRHRWADGKGAERTDLRAVASRYENLAMSVKNRLREKRFLHKRRARVMEKHPGLPSCLGTATRRVRLPERVPARFRKLTLYFVTVPRRRARPRILPRKVPKNAVVFALGVGSFADLGKLAKQIRRPVTLASADFARAMGVRCHDARVTIGPNGRWATVMEVRP